MMPDAPGRPCTVEHGGATRRAVCHGFGFKAWTHAAAITVGGFPAGQESMAVAIVELEDGSLFEAPLKDVTMLSRRGGSCPDCGAALNANWGYCDECGEWREL